ncbi:MAG TPA: NAD(P)-dependent oxidoreductase [Burkholderiaceae bacterium]|nr:NAD(P)-dependent oxidoreductase [Burkholderiaceae bacterium]
MPATKTERESRVQPRPRVLLTSMIAAASLAELQAAFEVAVAPDNALATLRALVCDAHAIVVRDYLPPDLCEHAPQLIAVARHGVGLDLIPVDACSAHGVAVSNVPGGNANSVVEYCVGAMLNLARKLHRADRTQRDIGWEAARRLATNGLELRGRCAAIIGCGAIGSRLAHLLHAGFGMQIVVATRNAGAVPDFAQHLSIDQACSRADFLLPCVPATAQTHHMIDARRLASMRPEAFIVNASRGDVIDEAALTDALRTGRIAGAALDVLEAKVPSADHPLYGLDNVLLTPHIGGHTDDATLRNGMQVNADLRAVFAGRQPGNLINPEIWPHVLQRLGALKLHP